MYITHLIVFNQINHFNLLYLPLVIQTQKNGIKSFIFALDESLNNFTTLIIYKKINYCIIIYVCLNPFIFNI